MNNSTGANDAISSPGFSFTVSSTPAAAPRRTTMTQKALWLVAIGLLANAGVSLYTHVTGHAPDIVLDRSALAQTTPGQPAMLGARGLYMMPAQLGPSTFGLYLMDVDAETICVYRASPDQSRFQLMAARTFKWDVQLEDFNNGGQPLKELQHQIENQHRRIDLNKATDVPTVSQNPKPDENLPDPAQGGEAGR